MKARTKALVAAVAVVAGSGGVAVATSTHARETVARTAGDSGTARPGLDPSRLQQRLDALHAAGMPGAISSVRNGEQEWNGAAGVADTRTGRPVAPGMGHRVGSITKTFTATAVLLEAERGRIALDAPIGTYLPTLVPGARGKQITVRMLLNHTSGIGDYLPYVFPSLGKPSPASLDAGRFRRLAPATLIAYGLKAPATGKPGGPQGVYSNTNYVILGELLRQVTGGSGEDTITRTVINRVGLRNTHFPQTTHLTGPHSRMYESLYSTANPPRDYSVYDMSWAGTAGALVSTTDDLNRFFRALLSGRLIGKPMLAQMQKTIPLGKQPGAATMQYGLGLLAMKSPCGTYWGHDGMVWGASAFSLTSPDTRRQVSLALNLTKYGKLDGNGQPQAHPIDPAQDAYMQEAVCGGTPSPSSSRR